MHRSAEQKFLHSASADQRSDKAHRNEEDGMSDKREIEYAEREASDEFYTVVKRRNSSDRLEPTRIDR